jgi:uncharacterized protein (TIGR03437 family)
MATDASGNIYVAGTTTSPDFQIVNGAQPKFGEAEILRSTDLGVTWTPINGPPGANLAVVTADPVDANTLYAGGSTGIYKSTNGGQTWTLVYASHSGYFFEGSLVVDPGNHLRVAAVLPFTGAVIRSVDGGATWTMGGAACQISNCGAELIADPTGSGKLLLVSLGLYISQDWGLTFQQLSPPGGSLPVVTFDPSHAGWIYVASSEGVTGTLSLSMNYGATWTAKASPPTTFSAISTLAVDPSEPNILVATTADGLYKSMDGAASWTLQARLGATFQPEMSPLILMSHSCAPQGGLFALGLTTETTQVAFSSNYGLTWMTPQLTNLTGISSGPGCAVYVTRTETSDAFVAKLAPNGGKLWATYLGGSDQDVAVGIAVDSDGNVYVAGNTSSPDFPVTLPRIGVLGSNAVFVTKYSPSGQVAFSVLMGGEAGNTATGTALDASGSSLYIAGNTSSLHFPVASSALSTVGSGFVVKLSATGSLTASTLLGQSTTGGIVTDANNNVIVSGLGDAPGVTGTTATDLVFVTKLDPALSVALSSRYLPAGIYTESAPTGLAIDAQGNLFAVGESGGVQASAGAYSSPLSVAACTFQLDDGDVAFLSETYVTKLAAADWSPMYTALLQGPCEFRPGALALDSTGAPVFAFTAGDGAPLHTPLLAGPTCAQGFTSGVAKLSADGSSLLFATYLDACGIPALTVSAAGTVYAGVAPSQPANQAGVLRLNLPATAVSLDGIVNAFSGDASAIVPGGLYSLSVSGVQLPGIDLGLNAAADLPTTLGGVQVTVDGVPAPLLQTSAGQVIATVPGVLPPGRLYTGLRGFRLVQVAVNGVASNAVLIPVSTFLPGLLTRDFPNTPYYRTVPVDAMARNEDGTLNDADHPAALGSTITLYASGMGATDPVVSPGSIADSTNVVPETPIYSSWEIGMPGLNPVPEMVTSIPGFVSAMFQVRVQVQLTNAVPGTSIGNGVQRVSLGVGPSVGFVPMPPASNYVSVYVQ